MSSARASVSQLDAIMAGIVSSSDLLTNAAASMTGATTTAAVDTATKLKKAVEDNLDPLDLKLAHECFKTTFDFDAKATALANNLCEVTRDEYHQLVIAAGADQVQAGKDAVALAGNLKPKFESACQAANALITNKLDEFIDEQEKSSVTENARMSILVHKAVQDVHDQCLAATTAAGDEIVDVDLEQAETKFRSDTKELHAANYAWAYQVLRTDKASATLDLSTATGKTADVLSAHEKQLIANERLSANLLTKRNDMVMRILGRSSAAPKANFRATENALKRIKELKLENDADYSKRSSTIVRDLKDALVD